MRRHRADNAFFIQAGREWIPTEICQNLLNPAKVLMGVLHRGA
jgi:hypothetical protein